MHVNLYFHQAALGDFALTLPLVRSLAAATGSVGASKVTSGGAGGGTVVVAPWSRAWLAGRLVEHVMPMDIELWEFARLHAEGGPTSMSPAVAELFKNARLIVSFVSDGGDHWAANVLQRAPHATVAFVDPRPTEGWPGHITDWHRDQLEKQGVTLQPVSIQPRADGEAVVIHPGSGGEAKCWPRERFEQLIQSLRERGKTVRPILGEVELATWQSDQVQRWRDRFDAVECMTVEALYDVLDSAAVFVGNDAGPTHLAAQMGLRTVALYGPTDPKRWSPVGPGVVILAPPRPQPMDWLGVEAVLEASGQSD